MQLFANQGSFVNQGNYKTSNDMCKSLWHRHTNIFKEENGNDEKRKWAKSDR